ncbi:MAG: 30S ribosomal protein S15 [Candidatus Azambacteria bacterium]|nr:30S ribosomal protein S15 [Candidatus Azambacteria bacterium]
MLKTKEKQKIIEVHKIRDTDTGSVEVQVAVLSKEIDQLATHLKKHAKDNHSRRGLLGMVSKRKRLLNYLAKEDLKRYASLIKKIGLKK